MDVMEVVEYGRVASFVAGLCLVGVLCWGIYKHIQPKLIQLPFFLVSIPLFGIATGSSVNVNYNKEGFNVELAKLEQLIEENTGLSQQLALVTEKAENVISNATLVAKSNQSQTVEGAASIGVLQASINKLEQSFASKTGRLLEDQNLILTRTQEIEQKMKRIVSVVEMARNPDDDVMKNILTRLTSAPTLPSYGQALPGVPTNENYRDTIVVDSKGVATIPYADEYFQNQN
jgi:hypothetical protein